MRRVKIVILILKNCLVDHDRFKWHTLCLELKTVEKIQCPRKRIFEATSVESYLQLVYLEEKIDGQRSETYIHVAAGVDASWEKVRQTSPSHNINIINVLCKQKFKSWRINIFERHVKLRANSWHS